MAHSNLICPRPDPTTLVAVDTHADTCNGTSDSAYIQPKSTTLLSTALRLGGNMVGYVTTSDLKTNFSRKYPRSRHQLRSIT